LIKNKLLKKVISATIATLNFFLMIDNCAKADPRVINVLVVGDEGVGKTTICNCLCGYPCKKNYNPTVNIAPKQSKECDGVVLKIFDLGSRFYYYYGDGSAIPKPTVDFGINEKEPEEIAEVIKNNDETFVDFGINEKEPEEIAEVIKNSDETLKSALANEDNTPWVSVIVVNSVVENFEEYISRYTRLIKELLSESKIGIAVNSFHPHNITGGMSNEVRHEILNFPGNERKKRFSFVSVHSFIEPKKISPNAYSLHQKIKNSLDIGERTEPNPVPIIVESDDEPYSDDYGTGPDPVPIIAESDDELYSDDYGTGPGKFLKIAILSVIFTSLSFFVIRKFISRKSSSSHQSKVKQLKSKQRYP
jgi:hypothetical protein